MWLQLKMIQKLEQKIHDANVNVNLMQENLSQIKNWISLNVDVSVKNTKYVKKNIFGILLHVVAKIENI